MADKKHNLTNAPQLDANDKIFRERALKLVSLPSALHNH